MNTAFNQYSKYLKHLLEVECAEKNLDFNKLFISYLNVKNVEVNKTDNEEETIEKEFWSKCDSKEEYEKYLQKYPNGKFVSEAKRKIAQLEELLKEEQEFWNNCQTQKDFENYLKKYPNGRFASEAMEEINQLEKLLEEEQEFWNNCQTQKDFEDYLKKYPNGKFASDAKAELDKIALIPPSRGDLEFDDGYYVGETKDGLMHGHGTRFWDVNDKKWTGDWVDGKACGHVVVTFGDFVVYDGQMENGLPNGQGVYYDINSGQRYEGNFVDFKREGEGILYTEDGDKIYEGEWKNNKYHGYGMFFLRGQCRYDGLWENGKRNGDGVAYNEKGVEEYSGPWKDDVRLNDVDKIQIASKG